MVAHLVLYRPRPGLDVEARNRFTEAIVSARRGIPAIRRFIVGRRMVDGPSYQLGPFPDFPYTAVIEFDDRAGLVTYLQHPSHRELGEVFRSVVESALVYDFDVAEAADVEAFLLG